MSPRLLMPSLFCSVTSRGRGMPTCVKGGVTHCKRWLVIFISTSTVAVDNSTICTNSVLFFFCGVLSLFGVVVYRLGERFILQGKVAALISWGDFRCTVSFSLLRSCCVAKITTMCFNFLKILDRILPYLFRRLYAITAFLMTSQLRHRCASMW